MLRRSPLLVDGRALLDADRILRSGLADRRASFELSVARMPPHTGFAVVAGIESLLEHLARPLVDAAELETARRAASLSDDLVARLGRLALTVDIDAVPDGTLAFVGAPVATIEGTFFETLLAGRLMRNLVQRSTAVATRTARLHIASGAEAIIDGSSGRSAAPDASIVIARAAHIGGAAATTNPLAAAALQIPFRAESQLELGSLAAVKTTSSGWGDLAVERLIELGAGDDEEAILLEAKRLGTQASGWVARGLTESSTLPSMRFELIALEEGGAWSPRRGTSGDADVVPGRKRLARYSDARGRAVADVVHLHNERMQLPKTLGAVTLTPIARPVLRGGRTIEAPEPASVGRERAIAGRQSLNPAVTHLRKPTAYRLELSPGLIALRDERR